MRNPARPIVAVVLTALLAGVAWITIERLANVDPRGRASWDGTAPKFDATPRDVPLFVPACNVSAVVLQPVDRLETHAVQVELFLTTPEGSAQRWGPITAGASPGEAITVAFGDLRPPWRAPLIARITSPNRPLTLDARRPITFDYGDRSPLGTLVCAFDGGEPDAWLMLAGLVVVVLASAGLGTAWLARAFDASSRGEPVRPPVTSAVLLTGATLLTYFLVVPSFEPPDELAHFQYARFVANTGALPAQVPPPDSEWRAASYEFVQQPLYYVAAAVLLKSMGLHEHAPALTLNPRSRLQPTGTEPAIFQHGAPAGPVTARRGLVTLRLASMLMALLTTWVIARLLTTVTSDSMIIATVAGGVGLIPQWCAVMGAVSTDPPATLLAATATLAVVGIARGRLQAQWLLFTGVLVGTAYAVKATTVFLLPMVILACVVGGTGDTRSGSPAGPSRNHDLRALLTTAVRAMLLVALGFTLVAAWVPLRAWLVFGDPQARAFKRAVLEAGGFVPTHGPMWWTAEFWAQLRVMVFEPFWARFGSLGAGPFPGSKVWWIYAGASVLLLAVACIGTVGASLAALADVRAQRLGKDARAVLPLGVCGVGVCAGLAAWIGVNLVPQADMVVHWTPRHILPLTAPAALLVGAGLERLRHVAAPLRRVAAAVTGLTIPALALAWLAVLHATVLMFHFGY